MLRGIRKDVAVPDGSKIVIRPIDGTTALIIFGIAPRGRQLGPDYTAKVTVNVETGVILKLVRGS